jgi:glycyl-tRNA synthetase beta chain
MDRELLLEIGVEELPASWLPGLTRQLEERLAARLLGVRLTVGTPEPFSTPRRLGVCVPRVADRQDDLEETITGPPVSAGVGKDAQPTTAGLGFARKQGVTFEELVRVQTPRGEYLAHRRRERGRPAVEVLPGVLAATLRDLTFPKPMRWDARLDDGRGELLFGRPIRWLLFLYGGRVVPFVIRRTPQARGHKVEDVTSGAVTFGHRFLATSGRPGRAIRVRSFGEYRRRLREHFVVLDRGERRDRIARDLESCARRLDGRLLGSVSPSFLDEVPDLVEYPAVISGRFDPSFLVLPPEVLTTTMIHHQHYFPVVGEAGRLKAVFLAVTNTQPADDGPIVVNAERVLAARLRDASFFWETDRRTTLESRLGRLDTVLFHKALGSYRRKAERIAALAEWIAREAFERPDQAAFARQAALVAKADLTTDMVGEFPELQGVMGGIYAREEGQPEEVWRAIRHHYLPIGVEVDAPPSGDDLGAARVSWAAVSLADKLDTVVALFSAGERPTGSRDPFGLRRQAQGVVRILVDLAELTGVVSSLSLGSLGHACSRIFEAHGGTIPDGAARSLYEFLIDRLDHLFSTRGFRAGEIKAVFAGVAVQPGDARPLDLLRRLEAFREMRGSEDLAALAELFKRVKNITKDVPPVRRGDIDWGEYVDYANRESPDGAERQLIHGIAEREHLIHDHAAAHEYLAALQGLAQLRPLVASYFDDVLVMAEDPRIRGIRLRVLGRLRDIVLEIADISEIVPQPES